MKKYSYKLTIADSGKHIYHINTGLSYPSNKIVVEFPHSLEEEELQKEFLKEVQIKMIEEEIEKNLERCVVCSHAKWQYVPCPMSKWHKKYMRPVPVPTNGRIVIDLNVPNYEVPPPVEGRTKEEEALITKIASEIQEEHPVNFDVIATAIVDGYSANYIGRYKIKRMAVRRIQKRHNLEY